jgi:small subunit ribosomal protein S4e
MSKNHLKRLAAPRSWPIHRKKSRFIVKPSPGPNNNQIAMPLLVILRDLLHIVKDSRETKNILNDGKVLVNDIKVKDYRIPVGFMDILSVPEMKKNYTVLINNKGKLNIVELKDGSVLKIRKIVNKTILKKEKIQLNFNDGTNLLVDKHDYKVGDSVVVEKKKVKKHLKMEKGAMIFLTGGKHVGSFGVLEEIEGLDGMQESKIIFKEGKEKYDTLKKYAYVVDKEMKI